MVSIVNSERFCKAKENLLTTTKNLNSIPLNRKMLKKAVETIDVSLEYSK